VPLRHIQETIIEQADLIYTVDFNVDLILSIIITTNSQGNIVNTNIYMDKIRNKKKIDFVAMDSAYLNLDKNRIITEQPKFMQAKFTQTSISYHANYDAPYEKLGKVNKRAQQP
jgi:hypothetical protein